MGVFSDDEIAEMAYELHRGYNHVIGDPWVDPPWPGLPGWHQAAVIDGVHAARQGLTPRQMHENWRVCFARLGWEYGQVKDPGASPPTHPDMVDWDDLPPAEQFKDVLFTGVVRFLARF